MLALTEPTKCCDDLTRYIAVQYSWMQPMEEPLGPGKVSVLPGLASVSEKPPEPAKKLSNGAAGTDEPAGSGGHLVLPTCAWAWA